MCLISKLVMDSINQHNCLIYINFCCFLILLVSGGRIKNCLNLNFILRSCSIHSWMCGCIAFDSFISLRLNSYSSMEFRCSLIIVKNCFLGIYLVISCDFIYFEIVCYLHLECSFFVYLNHSYQISIIHYSISYFG